MPPAAVVFEFFHEAHGKQMLTIAPHPTPFSDCVCVDFMQPFFTGARKADGEGQGSE
jgi:hypothetical protein